MTSVSSTRHSCGTSFVSCVATCGRSTQPRPRRATSPRMAAVDIDRQAIERRDFPIARRGYDTAAVDAHLRALAAEFEELQRSIAAGGEEPSLASTAATQVQSILKAAE